MGPGLATHHRHCERSEAIQRGNGIAAPAARPRNDELDGKAGAAAATGLRVGVGHLERRAAQILDEIDSRSADQVEADGVDDQLHAVGLSDRVVIFQLLGKLELVGEAGAAAAIDGKAEDRRLVLPLGDPRDALGRAAG